MRLHVKLKEFLSMFFMAILFFPAFNASGDAANLLI